MPSPYRHDSIVHWLVVMVGMTVTFVLGATARRHTLMTRSADHPFLSWAVPEKMYTNTIHETVSSSFRLDCSVGYKNYEKDYMFPYTIHWLKNGVALNLQPNGRLPARKDREGRVRAPSTALEISNLRVSDSGNYTCVVEAGGHQMQWHFFVEVKGTDIAHIPIMIKKPVNQTVSAGSRVVFECKSYISQNVEMKWLKHLFINGSWGNGRLEDNDSHIQILMDWNYTHHPLVLENVQPADEGYYTCGLRNSVGQEFEAGYLTVVPAPSTDSNEEEFGFLSWPVLTCISVLVLFTAITSIVVCVHCRKLHKRTQLYYNNKDDLAGHSLMKDRRISSSSSTCPSCSSGSSSRSRPRIPSHDPWEFPRNRLQIQGLLGEGAFGMVKKAMAHGIGRASKSCLVAVKTIKSNASKEEEVEFEKELEIMKAVRQMGSHMNVINFLGYCTRDGPVCMIVELAEKGNLRDYLISLRPQVPCLSDPDFTSPGINDDNKLSQKLLVSFCHQIARGMEFLAFKKCIHRDLAARNVLVTKDNVLKVADFGLARNGDYYKKTSAGQLPIKWMPPEALLHMLYTVKSDVWSFGVVMWEIFSLGGMPYPSIRHELLYNKLIEGYRMERPHFAPESLYATMKRCWNHMPEDRPDFSILVVILERQLVRIASGGYIEVLADDDDNEVFVADGGELLQ